MEDNKEGPSTPDSGKAARQEGTYTSTGKDIWSTLSIAALTTTPEGDLLEINARACEDLHFDDAGSPANLFDMLHICHGQQQLTTRFFERLRQGAGHVDLPERTYIRGVGSELKFFAEGRMTGIYDGEGRLERVQLLFRNIEEEMSRRLILDMALAQTKIFPWFYDTDINKMVIDGHWFTHLGYPIPQACAMSPETFFGLVHAEDRQKLLDAFAGQLTGKLDDEWYHYRLLRDDGSYEWFETQSVYLGQHNDGSPYRIVGICQSIQDHKIIENSLIAARDKARESDRLKSEFLANISHEIRTPLNAIIGFSNLLTHEEYPSSDEEKKEYSRLISENGEQLLNLISDILDISKIESNSMEFTLRDEPIRTLLTDMYRTQRQNMRPGVELILDLPVEEIMLCTDAARLRQILNSLLDNAVKFTQKGSITLGCRIAADGASTELFVRDTGIGIGAEHLEPIFERFYKVDTFVKGVGLGLCISRMLAEHMGGTLSVSSQAGAGSCFTVSFPRRELSSAAAS